MTYCANCGAPVEGRFCAKCGAPAVAGTPPPPGAAPGPPPGVPPQQAYVPPVSPQGLGMEENLAAALCYIPIIGLIFLLIPPYNQNRTIRFHAWQSLLYCGSWFVIMIGLAILHVIFSFGGLWLVWSMITRLVQLALLLGLIFAAVKAYQRERLFLPVIGPIAEKQAG